MKLYTSLLVISLLLLNILHHPPILADILSSEQNKTQVTTAVTQQRNVPVLLEVVGTLQAVERAAIAAKITGVVTEVPVVLGSAITKGDRLVSISAEEINARLRQMEAQLKQAERNLIREQNLLKKNASTSETVKTMQDRYSVAKAGYQEVKTMLSYTVINAPFNGVVTSKNINTGDLATPGTVLLTIENNRKLQVQTAVPESLVLRIQPGDKLRVSIPTAEVSILGVVAEVAPSADPASRTAPVTITLPFDQRFRSGQFARVMLPGTEKKSLFVPASAVVPRGQMDRVFVTKDNKAQLRLVRIGMEYDGMVEILSGLKAGERVIIDNNILLRNGQPVDIIQ